MDALFREEDIISKYTRADALADGVLIDLSAMAKWCGFRVPVAITAECHGTIVLDGRADLAMEATLGALLAALQRPRRVNSELMFFVGTDGYEILVKAISHGGDDGEHVITIMLPWED